MIAELSFQRFLLPVFQRATRFSIPIRHPKFTRARCGAIRALKNRRIPRAEVVGR